MESKKAADTDQFKKAIDNIGDVVAYLDKPEFAKFWDEDAKRVEAAVHRSEWNPKRRPTPISSRRRSIISATSSPISTSPNSPSSGTRTPSASRLLSTDRNGIQKGGRHRSVQEGDR